MERSALPTGAAHEKSRARLSRRFKREILTLTKSNRSMTDRTSRDAVFVDGCRTPFLRAGSGLSDQSTYDLARTAIKGLVSRTAVDVAVIDRVIMGRVIQDIRTSNVAREAALASGIPTRVPAYTVTMACISSNQSISSAADLIRTGQADIVVAGGTETLSDVPVQLKSSLRRRVLQARKASSLRDYVDLVSGLSPGDFVPESPSISEFSTGETMGESADKLSAMFDVSRDEQDEYAMRSHHAAAAAWEKGLLTDEVIPVFVPGSVQPVTKDNVFRADTNREKLASLSPVFVKPFGTITAGNSSHLTDGASAALLTSRHAAEEYRLTARAFLRDYVFVAQDPGEELLLGPAYAIPMVLERAGLTIADVHVFELHEAFAGQVLAVLRALESEQFARDRLGRSSAVGSIPIDRLNILGGSLSLGHPFGATGARLVTTAVNRLHREDGQFAVVAACAAGGLGHAMLIEREY